MSLAIRNASLFLRRPSLRLPWIVAALLLLLGTGTGAYAFWASTTSSSNAAAAADALSPGSKPAVTAAGSALTVTWAGGTTVNGRAATGYTLTRYSAATGGTATAATGGCAGTVTTLTCTEQSVPGGIWYYTVTPRIALWTGAESPRSSGTSNDSTAPVATVSGISPTPNAAGWNNTSPVSVTVTADDGTAGSGVASISYTIDGGAQQTVGGSLAVVHVSGDGAHTVTYFATDKVGNAGSAQSQTVRIDTQAPAAPVFTNVPGYVYSANVGAVPVTGTAEANAKIALTASDAGSAHSVLVTITASSTGTWSASPDLSSLNQGTVTYSATATDVAGNTGAAKTATSVKDTLAPAAAQGLSVPTVYVNSAGVTAVPVSGSAEAGASVAVSATSPGSATPVTGTATANGGTWSLNLNITSLTDGTVTYTVTVTDAAGNTSAAATATDTKDTVAPALTITAPMYASTSSKVSGTTDAGTIVNLTVRDSALKPVTTQVLPTGTSWSTTVDISSLSDGTLTYTATTTDAAGNPGTATASGITAKDTAAPSVTGVTLVNSGGTLGKVEQGDSLTIQFSEQIDATKICSSWTNTGTQTLTGNNNVTINISTSNVLTVTSSTSSTCPALNVGSIALGPNAKYASAGALSFGANGNASNWSSVTWDGSTTLTLKLGKSNGGTSGTTTTADAPSYTPAPGLSDLAGNPLSVATVTATAVSRF